MFAGFGLLAAAPLALPAAQPAPCPCAAPAPAPAPAPCQCKDLPPIVENRQFQYNYPQVEKNCDQHYTKCSQEVRDNNIHVIHDRVVLNNVNRHHHHVNRIYIKDNYLHHFNTNNVTKVNDIHHYRTENVSAPGKNLADFQQTQRVEHAGCKR